MLFGIASAVGGSLTAPGFLCGFSIFILQVDMSPPSLFTSRPDTCQTAHLGMVQLCALCNRLEPSVGLD